MTVTEHSYVQYSKGAVKRPSQGYAITHTNVAEHTYEHAHDGYSACNTVHGDSADVESCAGRAGGQGTVIRWWCVLPYA